MVGVLLKAMMNPVKIVFYVLQFKDFVRLLRERCYFFEETDNNWKKKNLLEEMFIVSTTCPLWAGQNMVSDQKFGEYFPSLVPLLLPTVIPYLLFSPGSLTCTPTDANRTAHKWIPNKKTEIGSKTGCKLAFVRI